MQRSFLIRLGELRSALAGFPLDAARNTKSRKTSGSSLAAMVLMTMCCLGLPLQGQAAQQTLRGHVPAITKHLKALHRLESTRQLSLAIGLPLRNREQLTNLLEELYEPSDAHFRHYLKPDEFATTYGPSEEDYQKVIDFAESHGLVVQNKHPNRTLLDVTGSVDDIEKAFHIHMLVYQHPTEERTFFAPNVEPTLDLDVPVLAISGLDDYVTPRPRGHLLHALSEPAIHPLGIGGGGGGGNYSGPYFGTDFRSAYAAGFSPGQDGTGQSLGLFELSGYYPGDISSFESEVDFTTKTLVTNILIDGFDGDDTNMDYALEVTGDIEMAISMAPGLENVFVYEGPTPMETAPIETNYFQYSSTTAQINDVLNRMATDDLANQLSCSYQMDINLSTVQIFQQFAAQGQSFFQGSGDFGAYAAAIDEPADDPYITAVGGTTMTMNSTTNAQGESSSSWASEVVWLTPAQDDPFLGIDTPEYASGGGVSLTYGIPAWQQGISMTGNQGSTMMRNVPDVALVANNINVVWGNDPYYANNPYVELNQLLGNGDDFTEGGTSLATPLWAGFMAIVNEQGAANGQPPVGFANPILYAIGKSTNYHACFHDVTSGNDFTANSPTKYSATTGYDLCTGWGTIIGTNLMKALLSPPSESLVIMPPDGFTSFGAGGGPFYLSSQTYTLTNIGSKPLNWSLVNTSQWLSVSATSGTLNPGGAAATVTVRLNSTASNFLIGSYSGNVPITDVTDGTMQNREFDLYVGNGGFEMGDFTDWVYVGNTNYSFAIAGDDVDVAGTNALDGVPDELFVHSGLYGAYLGEWPDDGTLTHTIATTAGQQYTLSFWLTSISDTNGDTTPNDFTASWDGSTLYTQTNLAAFGWTNMQFTVSATGSSSTLEFAFSDAPAAFGLDDVRVEALPGPVLQSAIVSDGVLTFSWIGSTNLSYQVQSTSSLTDPNWTNVPAVITANRNVVSISEPVGGSSQEYYRVILQQAP